MGFHLRILLELQNLTQMLSYNRMNNQPLHLANIDFSYADFLSVGGFLRAARAIVDSRMGRCEWMAWMWSTHETTSSNLSASLSLTDMDQKTLKYVHM